MILFIGSILLYIFDIGTFNRFLNYLNVNPIVCSSDQKFDLFITVIDVSHGDSVLIKSLDESGNWHSALIDTGSPKYSQNVIKCLNNNNVSKLDFILISHIHSDHMGALSEILKCKNVDQIIVPNYFKVKERLLNYSRVNRLLKNNGIEIKNVKPNQSIPIGGANFDILYPIVSKKMTLPKDLNDSSIVGILKYNKFKMMFTGDATVRLEQKIINSYVENDLKCDILKIAHHGSNTSSSLDFLKLISPKYGIISSGNDKDISYPHPCVASNLKRLGIDFYNTKFNGNISIYVYDNDYMIEVDR